MVTSSLAPSHRLNNQNQVPRGYPNKPLANSFKEKIQVPRAESTKLDRRAKERTAMKIIHSLVLAQREKANNRAQWTEAWVQQASCLFFT